MIKEIIIVPRIQPLLPFLYRNIKNLYFVVSVVF